MFNYVRLSDKLHSYPDEHVYVWLAFIEAFDCFVRRSLLVRTGISRLSTWWDSVCHRDKNNSKAFELMRVQLGKLDAVADVIGGATQRVQIRHITVH